MSLVVLQPVPLLAHPRKRTASFSCPPSKAPRVSMASTLRRTESYIELAAPTVTVPYTRTLQYYKDQREHRRRATLNRSLEPTTIRALPRTTVRQLTQQVAKPIPASKSKSKPPPPAPILKRPTPLYPTPDLSKPRQTSPLSPTRSPLPSRPLFPRSKPEPDLYRKALKTSMKGSPEGQKILRMGPHLAVSMMSATMELERLVANAASEDADADADAEGDADVEGDVLMQDATAPAPAPVLTPSWVAFDDWEMVDCAV